MQEKETAAELLKILSLEARVHSTIVNFESNNL